MVLTSFLEKVSGGWGYGKELFIGYFDRVTDGSQEKNRIRSHRELVSLKMKIDTHTHTTSKH